MHPLYKVYTFNLFGLYYKPNKLNELTNIQSYISI